ncbi:aProt_lowcomp, TIGR02302 family protein [Rhabdaerophilaceae bacterium]
MSKQGQDDRQRTEFGSATAIRGMGWRATRTALGLWFERLAPALMLPVGLAVLFVAAAWMGLQLYMPPLVRLALVLLAGSAILAACLPILNVRRPTSDDIARRLDLSRPDAHRPLATLADRPASGTDPALAAVWDLHRSRALAAVESLSASAGDARLRGRDRMALRFLPALALFVAAFVAGDERHARFAAAFEFTAPEVPPIPPRLDVWIDPPAYTGRPPIFVTGTVALAPGEAVRAPVGSILMVRSTTTQPEKPAENQPASVTLAHGAGLLAIDDDKTSPAAPRKPGVELIRRRISGDDVAKISRDGRELVAIPLSIIPDLPPNATLNEAKAESASPERQNPGSIRLSYLLEDDYGIAKGDVLMERATTAPAGRAPRPTRTLYPAPRVDIPLRLGPGEIAIPTEEHPWAGEEVTIRLRVEDDIGQVALSVGQTVRLPQKPFSNALARALIEQRRNLVFAPDNKLDVIFALDALLFEPERFTPNTGEYLMLDTLRQGVRSARDDDALKEMVDRFWEVALYIENGDMTETERRLREAEARLREALEREAPQNEIRRLTQELRRAMEDFLREFAERALRDRSQSADERNPANPERYLTQRDLQDMLRKIEEMARSGNMAEARRMLEELRQLMEQLRSARRQQNDPRMQELGRQLEELDRLQREQRELRDRTFQQGQQRRNQQGQQGQRQQGQRQPGQRGQQPGEQGESGDAEQQLRDMQQALRDRLQQLRDRLKQQGMQEGEGMGDAEEGMGDAEGQLGQGRPGQATEGQQRALDGLGRAAEGLAQQLQQQMGQNPGEGEGDGEGLGQPGQNQRGRAENRTDPLGRPQPNQRRDLEDSSRVEVPDRDSLQGSISERAERVLRELRKRLGEFERPREELEYLERLLRQR